jgi:Ca-activated chloride channel homolog
MMFLNPEFLILLVLPLIAAALYARGYNVRSKTREELTGKKSPHKEKRKVGTVAILLGLTLGVFTLMRPVSDPEEQIIELQGRNIVFLIDVSRSMLAEDLVPNRLDRARFDIQAAIPLLQGHRVALVAFAGDTVLKCPLTTDYTFFNQALSDLSVYSVSKGGSSIGDAIRYVINHLLPEDGAAMDIVLITDGEDQDTYPVEAAHKANDKNTRIVTVGMGDEDSTTPIPETTYNNEVVFSHPDMKLLKDIAQASQDGWMVSVSDGSLDLPGIIKNLKGKSRDTGSFKQILYKEHYQWLLLPAFFLILFGLYYRKRYGA